MMNGAQTLLFPPAIDDAVLNSAEALLGRIVWPNEAMRQQANDFIVNSLLNAQSLALSDLLLGGILSLIGVFLLYNLRSRGLLYYASAQFLQLPLVYWLGGYNSMALYAVIWGAILSGFMVGLFVSQRKYMVPESLAGEE